MDLAYVPEIGPAFAQKIAGAGVPNVEALAVWDDLDALALRAGIDRDRIESFRDAARAHLERALADAGVQGPEALAVADVAALAQRTGLDREHLARYQRRAQDALGKVVLLEGAPVARVHVGDATHHAVPLVTATQADDDDAVLARAGGDAVLLKPALDVVPVLIGGVTHRALPLYKERRAAEGVLEEVRVRVSAIRDVPPEEPAKKGGIGKLFGRGKK